MRIDTSIAYKATVHDSQGGYIQVHPGPFPWTSFQDILLAYKRVLAGRGYKGTFELAVYQDGGFARTKRFRI